MSLLHSLTNASLSDVGPLRILSRAGPSLAPNGCSLNHLPYPHFWPEAGPGIHGSGWQLASALTPVTDCGCDSFPPVASPDGGDCVLEATDPVEAARSAYWSHGPTDSPFYPMFPAASPWVTSVGATQLPPDSAPSGACDAPLSQLDAQSEVAASLRSGSGVTSGGGFSMYSPQPEYQAGFVGEYLRTSGGLPPVGTFYPGGRGYPDVALNGHKYLIVAGNGVTEVDGTSASAPALAAMVTLLNDELLASGSTPLGFLNPLLYYLADAAPWVFNDVTSGDNRCAEASCCRLGFDAAPGWDPVTGLGTVNFAALRTEVLRLKGVTQGGEAGGGGTLARGGAAAGARVAEA